MQENTTKRNTIDPRCHVGEIHGIYKIIDVLDGKDKYGHYTYIGECMKCGYKKYSHYGSFSGGTRKVTICNHLTADGKYIQNIKWDNHRIQNIFNNMKHRCYNENNKDYKWYGAKGIKICDEWLNNPKSFEEWSLKNGYQDNLTIDRIDENKDYSPNNCRWILLIENARRSGKVNWITIDEETLTGRQWAEKIGLGILTIDKYIKKYGLEKTKELVVAMIKQPPSTKHRKSKQTWFSVYGIQL